MRLDPSVIGGEENATTGDQTGDVMFTHFEPLLSEVDWTCDRQVRPHMPGQWVPAIANLCTLIVGDPTDFYAVGRRVQTEGLKRIDIRRADDLTTPATTADYRYHPR